ncbi:MAG: GNAT family N-acetyltransferase [Bacteroidia bacterium]
MSASTDLRPIQAGDLRAALDLYLPYIEQGPFSLEYVPPSFEEWTTRVQTITADYPWLVCTEGDHLLGYAYASRHRVRIGYAWVAETTIYLAPGAQGRGIGRILYETLFDLLRVQGIVQVLAIVGLPNARSEAFHARMGFGVVGVFKDIGFKAGQWQDTRCYQMALSDPPAGPVLPRPFPACADDPAVRAIFDAARQQLRA